MVVAVQEIQAESVFPVAGWGISHDLTFASRFRKPAEGIPKQLKVTHKQLKNINTKFNGQSENRIQNLTPIRK
jgi:hypothetical protein